MPPWPDTVSAFLPPLPVADDVAEVGEHAANIRKKAARVREAYLVMVSFPSGLTETSVVALDVRLRLKKRFVEEQAAMAPMRERMIFAGRQLP